MIENVLDSSVVLAILRDETIDELAFALVDGGVMSAVNVAEVYAKVAELKIFNTAQVDALLATLNRIEPFTAQRAKECGLLRARTIGLGLSLGDRACLALALEMKATVYTVDRAWSKVNLGCRVRQLR